MEHWDFLIQREGDRVWLPLSSAQTTLTPGCYQVIARTTQTQATAEVCVRYDPSDEAGEQQFSRSAMQTDDRGTVEVLPPTQLRSGTWELSCGTVQLGRQTPHRSTVHLYVSDRTPATAEPTPEPEPPTPANVLRSLALELDRETYSLRSGEPLVLSGRVKLPPTHDGEAPVLEDAPPGLHLRIRLREPQSLHVILTMQRLLPRQVPPLGFSYSITIPPACQSRLILGEVLLCDTVPTVLAKQSFTVTARLDALLNAMADGKIDTSLVQRSQVQPQRPTLAQNSASDGETAPQPEGLPPRLDLPQTRSRHTIDLPDFRPKPPPTQPVENPFGEFEANAPLPLPPSLSESSMPAESSDMEPPPSWDTAALPPEPSFPPLTDSDRFSSRLTEIAHNNDLSEWMAIEAERPDNPFALTESENDLSPWEASEIVVDDEPPVPPSLSPETEVPAKERPVPTPELLVPKMNLWVGRPVLVRVRLPQTSDRIYVKLWIHDRQNQALLDGPRWLTDFFPVEAGTVESIVQLTIPRGGLELQFEAIAVDVETERESYKVAVSRRVSPPGMPTLPLMGSDTSSPRPGQPS